MDQRLYSVEQVADLLGLHVKTVRGYVRDGRLKAVRIGKRYRITADDLAAFTGGPVPAPRDVPTARHADASCVVQIDAISPEAMTRLTNTLVAAANGRDGDDGRLRIENVYDQQRAALKVIVLGDLGPVAEVLRIIDAMEADRS